MATMQKHRDRTEARISQFLSLGGNDIPFEKFSIKPQLWSARSASSIQLEVYAVPGLERIPFDEAVRGRYEPAQVGMPLGPSWATFWFRVTAAVPIEFAGQEVVLNFDADCEAMVWSKTGVALQGLTGGQRSWGETRRVDFRLTERAVAGEVFSLYVEVACNQLWGNGEPADPDRYYTLKVVELAVPNRLAWSLLWDMEILLGIIQKVDSNSQVRADALYSANKILNTFRHNKPETLEAAHAIAKEFFAERRDTGGDKIHEVTAIGHCHIDTGFLWPYDETKRKSARSWATQLRHMEYYPDFIFAASQAQQYEWVEDLYPELFSRIQKMSKEGRFVPMAGTWVEMDTNMPTGEALCRQFLYGQRYMKSRFGSRSPLCWLPDSFGFTAQLPQIIEQSGMKYFFTTKLDWNTFNKFPNTTFTWRALDGTPVLTHFASASTYVSPGRVEDIVMSVTNNKDKFFTRRSLLPYGNGDGGGGPTPTFIERLERMKNLQGLQATVRFASPVTFFEDLEKESVDLNEWIGELYLEYHRGTYTSQALVKRYNRKSEVLLRELDLLFAILHAKVLAPSAPKPPDSMLEGKPMLDSFWKTVLLNQFHDVLPGSSIALLYTEVWKMYEDLLTMGTKLKKEWFEYLLSPSILPRSPMSKQSRLSAKRLSGNVIIFNTTSSPLLQHVVEVPCDWMSASAQSLSQIAAEGTCLAVVDEVPPWSCKTFSLDSLVEKSTVNTVSVKRENSIDCAGAGSASGFVTVEKLDSTVMVENSFIKVAFDIHGRIVSFIVKSIQREAIADGALANQFVLYEDLPLTYDAWELEAYHAEKSWSFESLGILEVEEEGPVRAVLRVSHVISEGSTLSQKVIITGGSEYIEFDTHVNWHEDRVIMKVEFPLNVSCDYATYETAFGVVRRPTHYNTTWDLARFEVCAHRFADLSEYDFGVALLNDCKYGHSCYKNVMRLTLLKAPKVPDADCDMGEHRFKYALYPHVGSFNASDVVARAYQFNVEPMIFFGQSTDCFDETFFQWDAKNVVLESVKRAEPPEDWVDGVKPKAPASSGSWWAKPKSNATVDVVLRFYEAYGGRATARIACSLPLQNPKLCNILEDAGEPVKIDAAGRWIVEFAPFKIVSIRATLGG
ncbi:glycosyl hydrolases family 38 N-terminal domain-containing protein [Zopfochytrium polystomum]|nr:glycosyl hydrolases family 38 N-terminal domain-containing protein [Zopfochytrium polystomum]